MAEIPLRADGTPRSFWYDGRGHVIHRDAEGTLRAWNHQGCNHHPGEDDE